MIQFYFRYKGEDPTIIEQKKKSRSLNITIVYPPSLVGEYSFRLSEWTPLINLTHSQNSIIQSKQNSGGGDFCPLFRVKTSDDPFGCRMPQNFYKLPTSFDAMVTNNGFVTPEVLFCG
jgi:hypothetical protein